MEGRDRARTQIQIILSRSVRETVIAEYNALGFTHLGPTADGLDTMQLGSAGGKVALKGSGGVALASALNWYLSASPAPLGPLHPPLVVTPAAPVCR